MVSNDDAPQPPKVLSTPLEVTAHLRMLLDGNDPLIFTFAERSQRFQSYIIEVDRDKNRLVFDEMMPRDGEKFLANGEPFKVEGFHDGVRMTWDTRGSLEILDEGGQRSYIGELPGEVTYFQRRNAFRATIIKQLSEAELSGGRVEKPYKGKLLDISATGCKLSFAGDISGSLQLGQVYESFAANLPKMVAINSAVELRHLHFEERINTTFAGVRFHNMSGLTQRNVERVVYQLQRDARLDKDD
ncbi:flagellar brake protein [Pseudomonas sp. nanlin1]|uniref:flagellar brake protein n=1 Tax=Pseudomonas sp. nanlin1 TaxID=3040605 RepID=UPI00389023F5